jgi:small subunit ribosomal protein S20
VFSSESRLVYKNDAYYHQFLRDISFLLLTAVVLAKIMRALFLHCRIQEKLLANSLSAKKRASQAEVRRKRNASRRSMMRTYLKAVVNAIGANDKSKAETTYKTAVPILDKSVQHGLISKNKAARHKSRLNAQIKAM